MVGRNACFDVSFSYCSTFSHQFIRQAMGQPIFLSAILSKDTASKPIDLNGIRCNSAWYCSISLLRTLFSVWNFNIIINGKVDVRFMTQFVQMCALNTAKCKEDIFLFTRRLENS